MILEDARQAVAAVNRMVDAVRDDTVASTELRAALEQTRVFMAAGAAFQTAAAKVIAGRERHGDGGTEVLAVSAGLSQSEAQSQVKTAQALHKVPKLKTAVQSGDVPQANARKLADAITKTGAAAVAADDALLAQASSMRPEQFRRTAQRWITARQTDNGESEHARQRARRYLRFYNGDDNMITLHGEFDKITGTRIHNRLRHIAKQLLNNDREHPKDQRRQLTQCMADALQHCTTNNTKPTNNDTRSTRSTDTGAGDGSGTGTGFREDTATSATAASNYSSASNGSEPGPTGGGWVADITLLAHVDEATSELIAELPDGSKLPAAVLEELSCNARWTGLIYDHAGDAIWRSRSRRTVTETQWQTLLATYGGCFHCAAPPRMCQAHHITPYSEGGATNLNNLIMVCWNCHHRIHHHNWRIHKHTDGSHTLHPPDNPATQPRYGPACADDPAPEAPRTPAQPRTRKARSRAEPGTRGRDQTRTRTRDPALW